MPHRHSWLACHNRAAALGLKVAVFSRDGSAMVVTNWGPPWDDPSILGRGWIEHFDNATANRFLDWLRDGSATPMLMEVPVGEEIHQACLVKRLVGGYWLIVGASEPIEGQSSLDRASPRDQAAG